MGSFLKKFCVFSSLVAVVACANVPQEIKDESQSPNAFSLSEGNLIYAYAKPIALRSVLSGIPGSMPAVATRSLEAVYFDYSPLLLQGKVFGKLPREWINSGLWERRRSFENHSTLRESRYKLKSSDLYLSIPNKKMAYLSSTDFYSKNLENEIRAKESTSSRELIERSKNFPLFLRVASIGDLLTALKVQLPPILRLPFDELETTLTLEDEDAILNLSFTSREGTPPTLAVRFALNYVLGQFPPTPLGNAWKRVPIRPSPDKSTQVSASIRISQAELNQSLGTIARAYYAEQAKKENAKREALKKEKASQKQEKTDALRYLEEALVEDSFTPAEV